MDSRITIAVAIVGSVCFVGLTGLACYIWLARREKQKMERQPRGYVYTPPNGSQDPVAAEDTSSKHSLPMLRLKIPTESPESAIRNMLPRNHIPPDSYYSGVLMQPQDNLRGEEVREAVGMEVLSRQTTQYSRTSTLIAEADSVPSTPRTSQQPSAHRKLRRKTVPVPPIPQLPPHALHTPLTELIGIGEQGDGYEHRPTERDPDD